MSVNKVILVGRLGRDPELRYTGSGVAVANVSLATDESFKDRNGEKQKKTEWHKLVVWKKSAEILQKYTVKGTMLFVEGRIETRDWQDKEGQKRQSTEIVVSNFRILGGGKPKSDNASSGGGSSDEFSDSPKEIDDSDIPF